MNAQEPLPGDDFAPVTGSGVSLDPSGAPVPSPGADPSGQPDSEPSEGEE